MGHSSLHSRTFGLIGSGQMQQHFICTLMLEEHSKRDIDSAILRICGVSTCSLGQPASVTNVL